ncbi:MAG: hypothetical protein E7411_01770 [Ruminococcaceae bacterium]|nr:hypothetical protein [Oscillospiraceae bacterium]
MDKKKILTVFSGGTICTRVRNGVMDTDKSASSALIDFYKKSSSFCKDEVSFKEGESFHILSENMSIRNWNRLISYFAKNIEEFKNYDGIIVAHGTDTLAYSTALFSLLLKGFQVPVIFVSSNFPIMNEDGSPNEQANGSDNFKAAVECIYSGLASGLYATYKNPKDGKMYLHKGAHLIQCAIYDDNFYSKDPVDITDFKGELLKGLWQEKKDGKDNMLILRFKDTCLKGGILKINPYPGIDYSLYKLDGVRAVFHGTYHSGTSPVIINQKDKEYDQSSVLYLIDKCAEMDIPFYYSPSLTGEGFSVYASVPYIENHIVNGNNPVILYGDTDELVYAKLLIKYSLDI